YNLSDGQIQCYNNCKFRQSFDEQLLLDQNCIEYINSTNCYVEITFDYKERQVQLSFGKSHTGQTNTSAAGTNAEINFIKTTRMNLSHDHRMTENNLIYTCKTYDNCEKAYAEKIFDEYIHINFNNLEEQLSSLLFDNETDLTTNNLNCWDSQCTNDELCGIHYHLPFNQANPFRTFCEPSSYSYKINQSIIILEIIEGTVYSPTRIYKCNTNSCNSEKRIRKIDEIFENYGIIKSESTETGIISEHSTHNQSLTKTVKIWPHNNCFRSKQFSIYSYIIVVFIMLTISL
ncbi:unnamed protein product, partial [Didymodactylos carnosus]